MQLADRRTTRYTEAVRQAVCYLGHATNTEIANRLRTTYPHISATTVHRVTQRLYEDGELGKGPKTHDGAQRYDYKTVQHDHFVCSTCGYIRDISVSSACRSIIQCSLEDAVISGPLTVTGACKNCRAKWIDTHQG